MPHIPPVQLCALNDDFKKLGFYGVQSGMEVKGTNWSRASHMLLIPYHVVHVCTSHVSCFRFFGSTRTRADRVDHCPVTQSGVLLSSSLSDTVEYSRHGHTFFFWGGMPSFLCVCLVWGKKLHKNTPTELVELPMSIDTKMPYYHRAEEETRCCNTR